MERGARPIEGLDPEGKLMRRDDMAWRKRGKEEGHFRHLSLAQRFLHQRLAVQYPFQARPQEDRESERHAAMTFNPECHRPSIGNDARHSQTIRCKGP